MRRRELAVTQTYWQIIQLAQSGTLGQFDAWILANGEMHKVPVVVPRRFYINLTEPDIEADCGRGANRKRVNLNPPQSRPVLNLYEVELAETEMAESAQEMAAQMAARAVEGVYESQVPLHFQALLKAGCVVQVAPHARTRQLSEGFTLDELEFKTSTECPYLPTKGGAPSFRHVALYHSRSDQRGVYALLVPALSKCVVLMVTPFANKEVSGALLTRWFREEVGGSAEDEDAITVEVDYVSTQVRVTSM
jgi:DNA polymerase epsilon subunit 1